MSRRTAGLTLALALMLTGATAAWSQPFAVPRWTVDGGGMGFAQLGPLIVGGSIGQPDAGLLAVRVMSLGGGFWLANGAAPVDVPVVPPAAGGVRDAIHRASPNPFAGATRVSFSLSAPGHVEAGVFDVRGALVRTLESGPLAAGAHVIAWDARDEAGSPVRPGVYLLRVRIPALRDVQKLVILK